MPRISLALLATAAMALAAPAAPAQQPKAKGAAPDPGFTQREAHLHGKVVVNLALEGETLSAELDAPAINVVGFERAPRTDAEKRAVADVDRWLASGVGVLGVPVAARCERSGVTYTPPKLGGESHDHDHDHEHEHEHGEEADAEAHADYVARFTYRCANPAALAWADLWLVRRLKNVAEVEVNLVTPQVQTQRTLGADAARVELR
jgi:ABC-type nickel/cobalt efflux system permease component RcnA